MGLHALLRQAAKASRHEFSVLVPTDQARRPRQEEIDGIRVRRFRRPSRSLRWLAPTVACLVSAPMLVRSIDPDVVHLSYALPSGPGGMVGARLTGVPYVLSIGGNDVVDPVYPPPPPLRYVARHVAHGAAHVVCWSTPIRDVIVNIWGIDPDKVTVSPFGVDTDLLRPPSGRAAVERGRARWGLTDGQRLVLALQRLEHRKGVDVLIDAVSRMDSVDARFRVLVAGAGRERASLERQAASLGLAEKVQFLGLVDDETKAQLLAVADLLVVPSRHEGQGIVIAEAAASGTAAVSTDAGGTVDMIDDGATGLLVEPSNPEALAAAMEDLLSAPARLEAMGKRARLKAEQDLSIESAASRFVEMLESVVR